MQGNSKAGVGAEYMTNPSVSSCAPSGPIFSIEDYTRLQVRRIRQTVAILLSSLLVSTRDDFLIETHMLTFSRSPTISKRDLGKILCLTSGL